MRQRDFAKGLVDCGDVIRQGYLSLLFDAGLHQQLLSLHQLVDLQASLASMGTDAIQRRKQLVDALGLRQGLFLGGSDSLFDIATPLDRLLGVSVSGGLSLRPSSALKAGGRGRRASACMSRTTRPPALFALTGRSAAT